MANLITLSNAGKSSDLVIRKKGIKDQSLHYPLSLLELLAFIIQLVIKPQPKL